MSHVKNMKLAVFQFLSCMHVTVLEKTVQLARNKKSTFYGTLPSCQ